MPVDKSVAAELPNLRRLSRALTGEQRVGDAHVSHVLESILLDPSLVSKSASVKVSLLRQLAKSFELGSEPRRNLVASVNGTLNLTRVSALPAT